MTATMNNGGRARRWDPVVKLTHWGIVGAIVANAWFTGEGSGAHVWVGYALTGLLVLRLLWGLVGPPEARFSAFRPSPARAIAHVREITAGKKTSHASHNPLGALMVYAIWACLGVIIASGIAMAGLPGSTPVRESDAQRASYAQSSTVAEDEDASEGDEAGEHEESAIAEIHETAVNLLYLLIVLHLAGVLFETRRSGRNIVLAMLPGGR